MLDTPQGSMPLRYTVERIPEESDAQVAATIHRMCQYVNADCQSYPVQYDARVALAMYPSDPLVAVHTFVRSRMKFKRDEDITQGFTWMLPKDGQENYFVECLKRPVDVSLEYAATGVPVEGDCDDFVMFSAALLRALGIDCCFATVAANSKTPSLFSHVYTVAYWGGKRVSLDCSHGPYAGWEVGNDYGKFCEWGIYDRTAWGSLGIGIALVGWWAWRNRNQIGEFFK